MTRHVHLDPVGGIAGDMFVAAMLSTFPDLQSACWKDLEDSGVLAHVTISLRDGKSHGMAVSRFHVELIGDKPRATGHYKDLKQMLQASSLAGAVMIRALALLELLGIAESLVHGVALDDVHFHEVADWDSITDIVAAASLIEHASVDSWSLSALPTGSGLVKTEHGMLPVPAPATLVLLEGLITWDDGESGERVTPTGAAIAKYLAREGGEPMQTRSGTVMCSGMGAGQRELSDRPNILRCSLYKRAASATPHDEAFDSAKPSSVSVFDHETDYVAQLNFAVDDMSAEELAVALQFVRQSDGVIDVSHGVSFGKKGRMMFDITVLCVPDQESAVSRLCFVETSTLGIRVQQLERRVLRRDEFRVRDGDDVAGVKLARRPASEPDAELSTLKIENDDLRRTPGLYARRERARQLADAATAEHRLDSSGKN